MHHHGHTKGVQPNERPSRTSARTHGDIRSEASGSPQDASAGPRQSGAAQQEERAPAWADPDEPSPEVVALFLRPKKARVAAGASVAASAGISSTTSPAIRAGEPVPLDGSLIDSLTRLVTEMLQVHVRESVTAAVRALAPRLLVSLPPEDTDTAGDNQLRQRPVRAPSKPE